MIVADAAFGTRSGTALKASSAVGARCRKGPWHGLVAAQLVGCSIGWARAGR
jgi:hypothetical protein